MALSQSSRDTVLSTDIVIVAASETLSQATITKCSILNTDSVAHAVDIYRVIDGGDPDATNQMFKGLAIAANSTVVVPLGGQVLAGGQTLQASADANSVVNFSISLATNV